MDRTARDQRIIGMQLFLSEKIGQDFFNAAVQSLSDLLGGDYTLISSFDRNKTEATTLGVYARTELLDNFKYPLSGLSGQAILKAWSCTIAEGDCVQFEEDSLLKKWAIQDHVNVLIYDTNDDVIGNVAVLSKSKIENPEFIRIAVNSLSVRIQAEVERLSVETKLREQQERYEFALYAGGFGLYDWDTYTGQVVFDDRFLEIVGHTRETLQPTYDSWVSLVHPQDVEQLAVAIERKIKNGREYYGPTRLRIRNATGAYKWMQVESYSFYYDLEKKAKRNIGIIKNVDDEVKDETRLEESIKTQEILNADIKAREERYDFALKVGKLGVYDWHVKERKTIFSPILAELLSKSLEEYDMSFDSWLQKVHEDDHKNILWNERVSELGNKPVVYRLRNQAGEYRWVEAHNMAVEVDNAGCPVRVIGIVRDIDDAKRSADLLVETLETQKRLNFELQRREDQLTQSQGQLISHMTALQKINHELRISEARWGYALEGNGDGVIEWDIVRDEAFFTERAMEILGFRVGTAAERQAFMDHIHPESRDQFLHDFRISLKPPYYPFQMEVQLTDDQQEPRWVMFRGKVVVTDDDNRPLKMVGTVTDLSQHKHFQKELTIYEEMIKQNQSLVMFTTLDGTIEFVNNNTLLLLECRQHEIIGKNLAEVLNAGDRNILEPDFKNKLLIQTPSGRTLVMQVVLSRIHYDDHEIGYAVNGIDVSEKSALEKKLNALTLDKLKTQLEAQRHQTEMIIQVQENEKQSLARELHDGVGQLLSLTKLQLEELEPAMPQQYVSAHRNLKDLVHQISSDVKGLTRELMPLSIRRMGFESALVSILERYSTIKEGRVEACCKIQLHGFEPEQQLAIHLFRIAQEAINNSIKYSRAQRISLMCVKLRKSLNMIIEDDGIGFDYEQEAAKENSFGLKTMAERARLINGRLMINTSCNSGTTISLTISFN